MTYCLSQLFANFYFCLSSSCDSKKNTPLEPSPHCWGTLQISKRVFIESKVFKTRFQQPSLTQSEVLLLYGTSDFEAAFWRQVSCDG